MQYLPVCGTNSYSMEESVPKQEYLQESMKWKH